MSKTPFEIRLEVLEMAKSLVMEDYFASQNWVREEWEIKADAARASGAPIPDKPENPAFPTAEQILAKAKELKAFIDNA